LNAAGSTKGGAKRIKSGALDKLNDVLSPVFVKEVQELEVENKLP
jgi:hypothetical protein